MLIDAGCIAVALVHLGAERALVDVGLAGRPREAGRAAAGVGGDTHAAVLARVLAHG